MTMTIEERNEFTEKFFSDCQALMECKSEDYSHDGRAFQDFEAIAETMTQIGIPMTKEQVLVTLMLKHMVGMGRLVKDGGQSSQSPFERLQDIINYCSILAAMIHDKIASPSTITYKEP